MHNNRVIHVIGEIPDGGQASKMIKVDIRVRKGPFGLK